MYKVITPAGNIYCTLDEAIKYKKIYGYPYIKMTNHDKKANPAKD